MVLIPSIPSLESIRRHSIPCMELSSTLDSASALASDSSSFHIPSAVGVVEVVGVVAFDSSTGPQSDRSREKMKTMRLRAKDVVGLVVERLRREMVKKREDKRDSSV